MGYFKKFFLLFVPPIITKLFKSKNYQYISKFKTYKSALSASDLYFDKKATAKFLGPNDVESTGRFNLISLLILSLNKKNIEVLDYGGGANPVYSYIENATNQKIKTYIIEPENFCKIIKKKYLKNIKNILSI